MLRLTLQGRPIVSARAFATTALRHQDHVKRLQELRDDKVYNVPQGIVERMGRGLHRTPSHPIHSIRSHVEKFFSRTNPAIDGLSEPYKMFDNLNPIVTTTNNFDLLLTPKDHVSRAPTDTFYVNETTVLRTHTSAHQNELIKAGHTAFLVCGDVYRRDETDRTHYPIFHQMEGVRTYPRAFLQQKYGLKTEEDFQQFLLEDLKKSLEGMIVSIFGKTRQQWVDAYFPFTHPSLELEVDYQNRWLETLGCGVVHTQIMKNCGREADVGWAFGLGLERLAMVLFDIPDVRLFWTPDPRFMRQFDGDKIVKFQPFSKYPECTKDVSFWIGSKPFHANDFHEMVRSIAGDLVEEVKEIDRFVKKQTNQTSLCYRISYRSLERTLTNEEINDLQSKVRDAAVQRLGVVLR